MNNLLKTILEMTVFSSIMIIVILAIKALWTDKINLRIISLLWMLLLARLIIPITLESPVHLDGLLPGNATAIEESAITTQDDFAYNPESINNYPVYDQSNNSISEYTPNTITQSDKTIIQDFIKAIKSISIQTYLLFIWIIGACLTLSINIYRLTAFYDKLKNCETVTTSYINDLLLDIKVKLNVKKHITIVKCKFVDMPVMLGLIKPKILLPVGFENKISYEKLELILTHEVYHIKRLDMMKNYLWLLAKVIHWFNPLVWIAYKEYRDDIELAVDQKIISSNNRKNAILYSQSILDVLQISKGLYKVPLSLSFCTDKNKIKKRLGNIVVQTKKLKSAGFISLLIAMVMIVGCFTTACQSTPEQEFVQAKNSDEFNEKISQTNSPNANEDIQNLNIPTNISDTVQVNDLTVNINAEVFSSEKNYPVVYAEPQQITQEQANLILDALIGDSQLTGLREQDKILMYSREEIIKQLGIAKKQLSTESDDQSVASLNAEIERLEAMLDSAPDQIDDVFVTRDFVKPSNDGTVTMLTDEEKEHYTEEEIILILKNIEIEKEENENDFQVIEGICDLGKDMPASISIYKNDNLIYSHVSFYNLNSNSTIIDSPALIQELSPDTNIQGLKTTYNEAYQQAVNILGEIQVLNYNLIESASVPLGNPQQNVNDYSRCYEFIFSQPIEGVDLNYALASGNSEQVSEVWSQEYIKIYIDDTGIIGFYWYSPSKFGEIINSNVQLKSMDEIMTIFKQQINNKNVFIDDSSIINREINIDQIKLGMMKIKEQSSRRYIYIPVWDFYGYSDNMYDSSSQLVLDEEGKYVIDRFGHSYLTINAIDGSIIDRSLGY